MVMVVCGGRVNGMEDCWLVPGQQRLQQRLEPGCRCRMLMGGGTEPRVRASSAAPDPDFKSFLRYEDLIKNFNYWNTNEFDSRGHECNRGGLVRS